MNSFYGSLSTFSHHSLCFGSVFCCSYFKRLIISFYPQNIFFPVYFLQACKKSMKCQLNFTVFWRKKHWIFLSNRDILLIYEGKKSLASAPRKIFLVDLRTLRKVNSKCTNWLLADVLIFSKYDSSCSLENAILWTEFELKRLAH